MPILPTSLSEAFTSVQTLVSNFKSNESRYLSPSYQEAEVRKDFIDKFFMALGWDVNHDEQTNPYEQEVKVEPAVSAAGQRRADYAFRLAPNYRDVRFFVEAKKPYGELATPDNYFQTIRYAWNTETPLAVLSDFNELHILDCRYKPDTVPPCAEHPLILPCWAKPLGRSFVASSTTSSNCLPGTQVRTCPHGLRTLGISISLSEKRFL